MRISITDTAPGASATRHAYLQTRVGRTFAPFAAELEGAELSLDADEHFHAGTLTLHHAGRVTVLTSKSRRMTKVLANLLDEGAWRLEVMFPASAPHERAS